MDAELLLVLAAEIISDRRWRNLARNTG